MRLNSRSLDTLCAALADVIGIEAPAQAAPKCEKLTDYVSEKLSGRKADRIFMYNPDAIGEWIYDKYRSYFDPADDAAPLDIEFCTVMPSVTPVCFGTMYTGAQPSVHGITRYEKPVITIDTLFDALIRAGKKAAIVADTSSSMAHIYLEREMDYYIFDTVAEINACASRLIEEDKYDFIAVYNGNYDGTMHRWAPESVRSIAELRANVMAFAQFAAQIKKSWAHHDTLIGFAMDHGCHEIDGDLGSHGLDMPEDLNIVHLYGVYPKNA